MRQIDLSINWRIFYAVVGIAIAGYVLAGLRPITSPSAYDSRAFSQLPVLEGGRTKPIDSLARNALLMISGKQTLRVDGTKISAAGWLMDVMFKPDIANTYEVFEIDDPDVRGLLGIPPSATRRFSYSSLVDFLPEIDAQAQKADAIKAEKRSRFQRSILILYNKASLYNRLQNTLRLAGEKSAYETLLNAQKKVPIEMRAHAASPGSLKDGASRLFFIRARMLAQSYYFAPVPLGRDETGKDVWVPLGESLFYVASHGHFLSVSLLYTKMGDAYAEDNPTAFNESVRELMGEISLAVPGSMRKAKHEVIFNTFSPFLRSMGLYVFVLILIGATWLFPASHLRRFSFGILVAAFVIHTLGLITRMVLQGRPPVTNLYSSAIFVGWAAVLLSLIVEKLHRTGVGSFVGAFIGFVTLIVAHHLATQGDTLEMMRAVLDSNFWLATHVITITIGYSSTFLSGFLGAAYLFRRAFDKSWTDDTARRLAKMVYGVICFSTFFSFLGTILGGIWADQSWGRFWGWDPKENGALIIVLWNALTLHAWHGRLVKEKTVMAMSVFGNVVTALSWFGVNMLGIGLHSYGFMDKAFMWLVVFTLLQLSIMGLAIKKRN